MPVRTFILLVNITFLIFFLPHNAIGSQYVTGRMDHISIRDGLSHIGVTSFCADQKGFIWVGTFDGLNRYDGNHFIIYNHSPEDSSSVFNNRISDVLEYDAGHILVGTERGLCMFDKKTESFSTFDQMQPSALDEERINRFYRDSNGNIWVLSANRNIYLLSNKRKIIRELVVGDGVQRGRINDMTELKNGLFLISSTQQLLCCNKEFDFYQVKGLEELTGVIRGMVEVNSGAVILILDNGIVELKYDVLDQEKEIRFYIINHWFRHCDCISILPDKLGNIWVGTKNNGVLCLNPGQGNTIVHHFTTNGAIGERLKSNWIMSLYEDRIGGMWFGTSEQGISRYNPDLSSFESVCLDEKDKFRFNNGYLTYMTQLRSGLVLMGSRNGGVTVYDPEKQQFIKPFFNDDIIKGKTVSCIYEDHLGTIWFSVEGRILRLLSGKKQLAKLNCRQIFNVQDINVMSFCEDDGGDLWIGSRQEIYRIKLKEDGELQLVHAFNSRSESSPLARKIVATIYNDPVDNNMWIGTWYNGLYRVTVNGNENKLSDYAISQFVFKRNDSTSLRENFISCILRSTNKQLWVGTEGGGFSRFISDSVGFSNYCMHDGLSNDVVKNILEDSRGRLWISTNVKLNAFDPGTGQFKSFSHFNGIESNYFTKAAVKLPDGRMLLGGNEGFVKFNPDQIGDNNYLPVPEFGRFQLSYQTVMPGQKVDNKVLLPAALPYLSSLELTYDQNVFSIEMLGIHYDDARDLTFQYRLKGYDKEWLTTSSLNNFAAYTNVPHGTYTFEFMVANGYGQWSPGIKQIAVIIHPPFWLSGWAYFLYGTLIILVLSFVFIVLIKIERLNHKVKLEQYEKKKEQELHDVKLKFFTNISHEFRTPVALILGPVESLLSQFTQSDGVRHNLVLIRKQGNYLLRLLDQLLEFRKAESEALELKCNEGNITEHVKWIFKGFERQAGDKNIVFRFESEGPIKLWFDTNKVEKIVYNLISNAIKYTPSGGKVIVNVKRIDNHDIMVSVADTGPGLDEEDRIHVFDRFYRAKNGDEQRGTGIGLALARSLVRLHHGAIAVESEKGKGAIFSFTLPLVNDYLKPEQMLAGEASVGLCLDADTGIVIEPEPLFNESAIQDGKLVLIVEDHGEMRRFLSDALKPHYQVVEASNGREAFNKACELVPDLIISDVMMPVMDGLELLSKVKDEIVTSHIPVILLTAKNEIADKLEGLESGADDYIAKPFHMDHLFIRIKNLLDNREILHRRYQAGLLVTPNQLIQSNSRRDVEFINSLNQQIEAHLHDSDFGPEELGRAMFISRTGFYKKLKLLTGHTPGEYLKDIRIRKAGDLLQTGEYSVSEVIAHVGFKSRSHFYKCFKEVFGELPADFITRDLE